MVPVSAVSIEQRPEDRGSPAGGYVPAIDRQFEHPTFGCIRYRVIGDDSLPPIAVLGGISADRDIDAWWDPMIGGKGALDPQRFRLIGIDWLHRLPGGGRVDTTDQAAALAALLEPLRAARYRAIVGNSFGAMVGLAFAERYAERISLLVAISGAHRSTPSATAQRVLQRSIIRALTGHGKPERGLALARSLALTGYRPDALFDRRFHDPDPLRTIESLESYFDFNGRRFARSFDVERYLALSEAIDRHQVAPERIRCPVDLIGVPGDRLVPLAQLRALTGAIGLHARLHCIDSPFGHDAFLKSPELINPVLERVLDRRALEVCDAE